MRNKSVRTGRWWPHQRYTPDLLNERRTRLTVWETTLSARNNNRSSDGQPRKSSVWCLCLAPSQPPARHTRTRATQSKAGKVADTTTIQKCRPFWHKISIVRPPVLECYRNWSQIQIFRKLIEFSWIFECSNFKLILKWMNRM